MNSASQIQIGNVGLGKEACKKRLEELGFTVTVPTSAAKTKGIGMFLCYNQVYSDVA
jgi:hypothetical protein